MRWASTFKYLPIEYGMALAVMKNRSQRVLFDINLNGNAVRILLSNKMGRQPLTITRMTIGTVEGSTVKNPVEVTLNGKTELCIAPGTELFSDKIPLAVHAGDRLAVTAYIGEQQSVESVCGYWAKNGAIVTLNQSGDATDGSAFADVPAAEIYRFVAEDPSPNKGMFFYGFSAVQVYTADDVQVIAAFGDSITHMSYVTNELARRLYAAYPGKATLINCGIGGNRLVHDATYIKDAPAEGRLFGPAGVKRFEHDVYSIDSVDTVLALAGINDIMHPVQLEGASATTPPEDIEAGYQTIAAIAHRHSSRIFGATITPCGFDGYPENWMPIFEACRQSVNTWLRTQHPYDGLFDYDVGVRDDGKPGYMKEGYSIGDGLHPNEVGAALMVNQIELGKLISSKNDNQDAK